MKKVEELWYWWDSKNLVFDNIYIVPTGRKEFDWYKIWYYLGTIWTEIKILGKYDWWNTWFTDLIHLQWDFECPFAKGIRIWWTQWEKLKYWYWWVIKPNK